MSTLVPRFVVSIEVTHDEGREVRVSGGDGIDLGSDLLNVIGLNGAA